MQSTISYWSNEDDDAFATEIEIDETGNATLSRPSNVLDVNKPIGIFKSQLEVHEVEYLYTMVVSERFESIAGAAEAEPGEIIREIRYSNLENKKEIFISSSESAPAPEQFDEVEEYILSLADKIIKSPVSSLGLNVKPIGVNKQSSALELSLSVRNLGKTTLRLPRPGSDNSMELVLMRNDIPIEKLEDHHRISIPLNKSNLMFEDESAERIELVAGDELNVSANVAGPIDAGTYDALVIFEASFNVGDAVESYEFMASSVTQSLEI